MIDLTENELDCVHGVFSPTSPRTQCTQDRGKTRQVRDIIRFGGDEENRTPDPLLARQVLSQLSYAPTVTCFCLPKYFYGGPKWT